MSSGLHLIVPFASAAGLEAVQAGVADSLPQLRRLLARLQPGPVLDVGADDLYPPHERALAQALGLPAADGALPWAAWELAQAGQDPGDAAWAWITPCHWHVAQDHILMPSTGPLKLDEASSRALLAAVSPYFLEDGIELAYVAPTRWRARGEIFRGLACASLDRVSGRRVDDWLPRAASARPLRRLQQEMQMLLYTHPVNEARESAGLRPVNSFWVSGAGALSSVATSAPPRVVQVDDRLREPALSADADAWAARWREVDDQVLPTLLDAAHAGEPVTLTLCGERQARTWTNCESAPWWRRAVNWLRPPAVAAVLDTL